MRGAPAPRARLHRQPVGGAANARRPDRRNARRVLVHQDFNDDKKDAGGTIDVPAVDPLKYQQSARPNAAADSHDLFTLRLRYKAPDGDSSTLIEETLADDPRPFEQASTDFRFAASVASFGMLLRDSPHRGNTSHAKVLTWAKTSVGTDPGSLRAEFLTLVEKARRIKR